MPISTGCLAAKSSRKHNVCARKHRNHGLLVVCHPNARKIAVQRVDFALGTNSPPRLAAPSATHPENSATPPNQRFWCPNVAETRRTGTLAHAKQRPADRGGTSSPESAGKGVYGRKSRVYGRIYTQNPSEAAFPGRLGTGNRLQRTGAWRTWVISNSWRSGAAKSTIASTWCLTSVAGRHLSHPNQ